MSKPKNCKRRGQHNSSCACCEQAAKVLAALKRIDAFVFPDNNLDHESGADEIGNIVNELVRARAEGLL